MWIDDVKDNPVAQHFIEIAGKERLEEARRQGAARFAASVLVSHAIEHNVALMGSAEETETALTTYADLETLRLMLKDMSNMADYGDIASFIKSHGVDVREHGM
jgi:hypothetical protein